MPMPSSRPLPAPASISRKLAVPLVVMVAGIVLLAGCSDGVAQMEAAPAADQSGMDESGQATSNHVVTSTTQPGVPGPDAPAGADGNLPDTDVPAEQFTNQPGRTQGAQELPPRIAGYNFFDRDGSEQLAKQSSELQGVEVTVRSLDPAERTGSGFRPQIVVMKSPQVGDLFSQGAWQATQQSVAGRTVWVIGGEDASTQLAWVKKADTVILISGAPYSVLEPVMADVITNSP